MNKLFTFWHSARSLEEFNLCVKKANIDLLVDIRSSPFSRYFPHFNRKNLEQYYWQTYLYWWAELGGSPEFHNDLLEFIATKWENCRLGNQLLELISYTEKDEIFNWKILTNNEKRKEYITNKYLSEYLPRSKNELATNFLKKLIENNWDKNICFFCSEKTPEHCHRYHLLEMNWLKEFNLNVTHIEDISEWIKSIDVQQSMF